MTGKQARGELIEFDDKVKDKEKIENLKKKHDNTFASSLNGKEGANMVFLSHNEIDLRRKNLTSPKCSISLPFSLKKIITDDWEIITQCGMFHRFLLLLMYAFNAYSNRVFSIFRAGAKQKVTI